MKQLLKTNEENALTSQNLVIFFFFLGHYACQFLRVSVFQRKIYSYIKPLKAQNVFLC